MKLLLIGATGTIGSRILKEAQKRGHQVLAAARNPEKVSTGAGIEATAFDLYDADRFRQLAERVDTVIAAASPRNSGDPRREALAYAEALIAGIGTTRLVLVGGAGSLNLPDGSPVADVVPEPYHEEAQGMRAAFEKIAASDVNYTVQAPAGLIAPGERTGSFRLAGRTYMTNAEGESRISAEDFAVALLDEVETPRHERQIFHAAY